MARKIKSVFDPKTFEIREQEVLCCRLCGREEVIHAKIRSEKKYNFAITFEDGKRKKQWRLMDICTHCLQYINEALQRGAPRDES
jgi:hypothetical protein